MGIFPGQARPRLAMNAKTSKVTTTKPISQLLDKISNIHIVTFLILIRGVFMQNFSSLALKLREEFEVTDRNGYGRHKKE